MSQHFENQSNYDAFRDCVKGPIVQKLLIHSTKPVTNKKSRGRKNSSAIVEDVIDLEDNAEDFAEFVDVRQSPFYEAKYAESL